MTTLRTYCKKFINPPKFNKQVEIFVVPSKQLIPHKLIISPNRHITLCSFSFWQNVEVELSNYLASIQLHKRLIVSSAIYSKGIHHSFLPSITWELVGWWFLRRNRGIRTSATYHVQLVEISVLSHSYTNVAATFPQKRHIRPSILLRLPVKYRLLWESAFREFFLVLFCGESF